MSLPLLLLPGSMCDATVFAAQLAEFPNATVADLAQSSSIEAMAADVLVDAPDSFALAGLSLGGIVAAEIAAKSPERVAGLALISTNLNAPDQTQLDQREEWAQLTRAGEFARILAGHVAYSMTAYPAQHASSIFDMAYRVGPAAFLNQNTALMHRHDRRTVLEALNCPTLIASGAQDQICPPAVQHELATHSPSATLTLVDDCGHLATIDQPEALTRALAEWLEICNNQPSQEGTQHE